ncbi:MAG: low affinity iron permease family protein [Sphingomonas sp.]|uniref:low affinity iron permease family protein n=1 Tax=Sphingomonas sp. TaxID=28214 RepID=UPI00121547BC|nr:low affinity iron permease family protein [Sphingomonas sp.]THD35947.1 MAG: low affinity iron permease family protein [Sphingomonas sp.]
MERMFEKIAEKVAGWAGRPPAFIAALLIVIIWGVTGPIFHYSDTWQLIINTGTTIVTFLMVFLIQNAQNRDGSAIQAKLDEIIRATSDARNGFIGVEHLTQHQLELLKLAIEKDCGKESSNHRSVERLLRRMG